MGNVKKKGKKGQGKEPRAGRMSHGGGFIWWFWVVVLSGDLEKSKYVPASLSGKKQGKGG